MSLPLLASAALMVTAWLVPNHYRHWVTAHSELLAALSVLVTLCGGGRYSRASLVCKL